MQLFTMVDVDEFVIKARAAGQTYEDVRDIVAAAGWEGLDEWLPGMWEEAAEEEPEPAPNSSDPSDEGSDEARAHELERQLASGLEASVDPQTDLRGLVAAAHEAGESYDQVESLLRASGWTGAAQFLPALWEELEHPSLPMPPDENTSGAGGEVPPEVGAMGFSWGAFVFLWIWGLSNKVYLALLCFVPCLSLFVAIWLGVSGHKLAWQNRRFDSFEQYKDTMKAWNTWGVVMFCVSIVINIIGAAVQASMQAKGGN